MLTRKKCCCGPAPECPTYFAVDGCNNLGIVDVTITVWTDDTKTTQVGSVTTVEGVANYIDIGSSGSYYVEATHPSGRFQTFADTLLLPCGDFLDPPIQLTPASGYHCVSGCALPLADTLELTDNTLGLTATLTYSGGNWDGPSDSPATTSGCGTSDSVTVNYRFNGGGQVFAEYDPPGVGTTTGYFDVAELTTFDCPPAFLFEGTITQAGAGACSVTPDKWPVILYGEDAVSDITIIE